MTTPTPNAPLTSDSVGELRAGDLLRHETGVFRFVRLRDNGQVVVDAPVLTPYDSPEAFTFIGRPDEAGWMPWSGGENPVGDAVIAWRSRSFTGTGRADKLSWARDHLMPIIAFRLSDTKGEGQAHDPSCKCETCMADFTRRGREAYLSPESDVAGARERGWHGLPLQMIYELRHPDDQRTGFADNADLMEKASWALEDAADEIQRQGEEIERLRDALGDALAALASVSGLAKRAADEAVKQLQARARQEGA